LKSEFYEREKNSYSFLVISIQKVFFSVLKESSSMISFDLVESGLERRWRYGKIAANSIQTILFSESWNGGKLLLLCCFEKQKMDIIRNR